MQRLQFNETHITRPSSNSLIDHAWANFNCTGVVTLNAHDLSDHDALLLFFDRAIHGFSTD